MHFADFKCCSDLQVLFPYPRIYPEQYAYVCLSVRTKSYILTSFHKRYMCDLKREVFQVLRIELRLRLHRYFGCRWSLYIGNAFGYWENDIAPIPYCSLSAESAREKKAHILL